MTIKEAIKIFGQRDGIKLYKLLNSKCQTICSLIVQNFKLTTGASNGALLVSDADGNGTWQSLNSLGWTLIGNSDTNPTINFLGTTDAKDLVLKTNNIERVRILSGGNISVINKLTTSTLQITTGSSVNSVLVSDALGNGSWSSLNTLAWGLNGNSGINPTNDFIGTTDNQPLLFRTNNVERFRVFSNGNIGIGTTTDAGFRLDVNGSVRVSNSSGIPLTISQHNSSEPAITLENFSIINTSFKKVIGIPAYSGTGLRYLSMSNLDDLHWSHRFTLTGLLKAQGGIQCVNSSLDFNNSSIANLNFMNMIGRASISMRPDFNLAQPENSLGLFIAPSSTINPSRKLIKLMDSTLTNTFFTVNGSGQTAIGVENPTSSAVIQIDSTTRGFLPPRMTSAQRTAISSPAVGLIVYQTDATEGLYVNSSTGWIML